MSGDDSATAGAVPFDSQHTPGPWAARMQKHTNGSDLGWIIEFNGGRIGWSSYATNKPNEGETPPYSIGGANARLIAAAPTLLHLWDDYPVYGPGESSTSYAGRLSAWAFNIGDQARDATAAAIGKAADTPASAEARSAVASPKTPGDPT